MSVRFILLHEQKGIGLRYATYSDPPLIPINRYLPLPIRIGRVARPGRGSAQRRRLRPVRRPDGGGSDSNNHYQVSPWCKCVNLLLLLSFLVSYHVKPDTNDTY